MDFVGIDLHKTSSQICTLSEGGELTERRIKTTKAAFDGVFADRAPARILVEASTESEWVAQHLESLGHEVIVADPNFAPMYATRDKKIKTDKRDARALCEACRLGAYRPAHRTSDRQRRIRAQLLIRTTLVRTRSKYISLIGSPARREGCRIATGGSDNFVTRAEAANLPGHVMAAIAPLFEREIGRQAVAAARLEGDTLLLRLAQGNLAIALADAQEYAEARALFLDVLRMYEDASEPSEIIRTLSHLLHVDTSAKNWSGASQWAQRLTDKCIQLEQTIGVTEMTLSALGNIATFHLNLANQFPEPLQTERLEKAGDLYKHIAETGRQNNMQRIAVIAESQLSRTLHFLRRYDEADEAFEDSIRRADSLGLAKVAADSRFNHALMLAEAERLDRAAIAAADAVNRYYAIGDRASINDAENLHTDIQNQLR
ncbi:MAG TPA: transposase, partial [Pyrinomonadaceae bacterium]